MIRQLYKGEMNMRMKNRTRTLLALVLALMMVMSSAASVVAFAEGEEAEEDSALETPVRVYDGEVEVFVCSVETDPPHWDWKSDKDLTESGELDGDLVVDGDKLEYGPNSVLEVTAFNEDSSFSVNGSVEYEAELSTYSSITEAVSAYAYDGKSAEATITGDVSYSVDYDTTDKEDSYTSVGATGVEAYATSEDNTEDSSTASVTVDGNVSVSASAEGNGEVSSNVTGVSAWTENSNYSATVIVGTDDDEENEEED